MAFLLGAALVCLVLAAVALAVRPSPRRAALAAVALLSATAAGGSIWARRVVREQASRARLVAAVPELGRPADGYLGSGACVSCHPSQHASWRRKKCASMHSALASSPLNKTARFSMQSESKAS